MSQNHAVSIQPFDARIRAEAYVNVPYPFILGNTVAGTVEAIGPDVTTVNVGDRVVSDTPTYAHKETTKWGGWQQYVVSKATTTAEVRASISTRFL
jgi:NADPH:quinone reductase-like Zn-dependent oxidoreductase